MSLASVIGTKARLRKFSLSRSSPLSCRKSSLTRVRVAAQTFGPNAMKGLSEAAENTPSGPISSRQSCSSSQRSSTWSPIATPTRGVGNVAVENTP
jgi:hypothetical protein